MTAETRILVLAKPPRPGACKSRLAAAVGPGAAARLSRAFLFDTWSLVSSFVSIHKELDLEFAQSAPPEQYPLLVPQPTVIRQGEGDLGRRMATLVAGALDQRERVLLLGTDSPTLPVEHLEAALQLLDDADLVLGENPDGGFWCLGVRRGPACFYGNTWMDDLDWDRPDTRAQVEERAAQLSLKVAHVAPWHDVDQVDDLETLRTLLLGEPDRAAETARALVGSHGAGGRAACSVSDSGRIQAADGSPFGSSPAPTLEDAWRVITGDEPISIVIPTLNESVRLDACLDALAELDGNFEVIVADGGSSDRSAERAAARCIPVAVTGPGRGRQLAAGARLATGPVLLFLHADTRLPVDAMEHVRDALAGGAEAGAFVTHTVADPHLPNYAGPLLRLADIRSRFTRYPYGDQALFVTRRAYDEVGGFKALPIMEDYDLSRRLAERRPLTRVDAAVQVSGRRIQQQPLRAALLMRLIPPLYRLGVPPDVLARMYRR